jgi:flagellar FliJ protein
MKFRLATLLRLKEADRNDRRSELAEAFRAAESIEERMAEVRQNLDDLRRLQTVEAGGVDVDRLIEAGRYEMVLRVQQLQLEQNRLQVQAEVERRREVLVAADREVRVLEKLREKQQQKETAEMERLAMKRLDEVAGQGHWRREAESFRRAFEENA